MRSPAFLMDHNVDDELLIRLMRLENDIVLYFLRDWELESASDEKVLEFASEMKFVVVTYDKNTMIGIAKERIRAGLPISGLIVIRRGRTFADIAESLHIVWGASEEYEWQNRFEWIPY